MEGLMLYRQYLENIREEVLNYDLNELNSKKFIDILYRQKEINDLSNIEYILQKAGINGSFLGEKRFLRKKVVLKSKLANNLIDDTLQDDVKEAISECLFEYIEDEDAVLSKIDKILNTKGVKEIYLCPSSETGIMSCDDLIEANKSTLEALFGAMTDMSENKDFSDNLDMDEFGEEENTEKDFVEEKTSDVVVSDTERILDSSENIEEDSILFGNNSFLDGDAFEDIEDTEDNKKINMTLDLDIEEDVEEDIEEDIEEDEDKDNIEDILREDDIVDIESNYASVFPNSKYKDLEELNDDLDYENQDFCREATRHFLRKNGREDLKKLYRQKEKLSEDVSDSDDALAKTLLALGDGVMSLPSLIGSLLEKGKKLKNTMMVDDEGDNLDE